MTLLPSAKNAIALYIGMIDMEDQTKLVKCYIPKEDFGLFQAIINITGVRQSPHLAGRIFIQGLHVELLQYKCLQDEKFETKLESQPEEIQAAFELHKLQFLGRRREELQAILNMLATKDLQPEEAERLSELAVLLELDEEEAARYAAENPFASVVSYNVTTKLGQCTQWLTQVFSKFLEIPVQTILKEGRKKGFSEVTVRRAKRRLGIGHAKRESDGTWCWYPPTMMDLPVKSRSSSSSTT